MTSPRSVEGNPSGEDFGSRGLCLVGFMGSGKSTVGRRVASVLGWPFIDLDLVLAERHGAVGDQLRREGEAIFRERERAAALELCDGRRRVLALGGGAWAHPEIRAALPAHYRSAWLRAPLPVLAARVAGSDRPLWDADVEERYRAREPLYALADRAVDCHGVGPDEVAGVLVAWIRGEAR